MLMKKYRAELISIFKPSEGLYRLEFKSLDRKFKYHPGQFLHLSFDSDYDGSGQWPESRCFSIQSNPKESTLKLTYSVKGQFTRSMENLLRVGYIVWLKLPYGDLFSQVHGKKDTIFIAGGTGLTPFLSLFTDASFVEYSNPVLYAGFRNRSLNIYYDDFQIATKINPQFKYFLIYQEEVGILNIDEILNSGKAHSVFFISGPPEMIKTFRESLLKKGVLPSNILTDSWE